MEKKRYKTEQKEKFIEYISKINDKYICAEDIKKYLELNNNKIGLTTIYRFLNELEGEGKLRIELKNHTKYYQYISDNCNNHYHLKCTKCGNITHFECEELKKLNHHILKEHEFNVDQNVMISGICVKCLERFQLY